MNSKLLHNGWTVPAIAGSLAAAYLYFFFLPQQRAIAELTQQLTTEQEFVRQTEMVAPALAATETQVKTTLQYTTAWQEASPSEAESAVLFGQISELAKAAGVITTRFDPDTPVTLGRIRRIPLAIGCTGQFSQIARFLESVERLPQTIWVTSLRMEAVSEGGKDVGCEVIVEIFADNPKNSDQVNLSS